MLHIKADLENLGYELQGYKLIKTEPQPHKHRNANFEFRNSPVELRNSNFAFHNSPVEFHNSPVEFHNSPVAEQYQRLQTEITTDISKRERKKEQKTTPSYDISEYEKYSVFD